MEAAMATSSTDLKWYVAAPFFLRLVAGNTAGFSNWSKEPSTSQIFNVPDAETATNLPVHSQSPSSEPGSGRFCVGSNSMICIFTRTFGSPSKRFGSDSTCFVP
jgi:hypothetical protein